MKALITKKLVDGLSPAGKDTIVHDERLTGFRLKVTPTGAKIYFVWYRLGGGRAGTHRTYRIGRHGSPWTPEAARKEATRILSRVSLGEDPAAARQEARHDITVSELCDVYLQEGCTTKKASTVERDRSRIDGHIRPILGGKKVRELAQSDIEQLLADVANGKTNRDTKTRPRGRSIVRGGKGVATRTVGMFGAILKFAVSKGIRSDNPAAGVKRFADRKFERFLSPSELTDLAEALQYAERSGESMFAIAAIRLLILTGCRKGEILTLKWSFVDFNHSCLRLPDSKTGAKVVPLSGPALQILTRLERVEGNPFVVCGAQADSHFVGLQSTWERVRERAGLADVRVHDLRHTFASTALAGGVPLAVLQRLLGHKTASSTQRYAHLADDPVRHALGVVSARLNDALSIASTSMGENLARTGRG